jgi:hypothetical protein
MAADTEYQSLRLRNVVHKLRYGVQPLLVDATSEQTITRHNDDGYIYFRVMPTGVEIPLHNVASAIPKNASIASKIGKTVGAMKQAREAKRQVAADKAAAE